jgi:ATP-dependent HslUV protease ATP-binding subunit HslU
MELIIEDVSFSAPDLKGQKIPITVEYVKDRLKEVLENKDLSRYIL